MSRCPTLLFPALLLLLAAGRPAEAQLKAGPGDWPGWRGPDRTGLSTETGLLKAWPKEGPKLAWKITGLGTGYSTPSVAGGKLFVMGTEGQGAPKVKGKKGGGGAGELLIALDVKDGSRLWATPVGKTAGGYPGPRCTPTVDGDRIYALSSDGNLMCADTAKGSIHWQKNLKADFGGRSGGWAYTESPLIDGNVLVCTPGGDKATIVALNKTTGSLIWKSAVNSELRGSYSGAHYSSIIVAELGGMRQYVQFLRGGVVGVSASDGKLLWHYDAPANGTANCSTPIVHDGCVFASSAYGKGAGMARLKSEGNAFSAREAYFIKSFQNHHGGVVLLGEHLYGTNGSGLMCVHFKEGTIDWQARAAGKGSIVYADGLLIVRGEDGTVVLAEANPKAYVEKGKFRQPDRSSQRAWAHPVVAGGKLYLRDWDVLLCYDIKAE
jgi:outer membrane protein assembly factor BamB